MKKLVLGSYEFQEFFPMREKNVPGNQSIGNEIFRHFWYFDLVY